MQRALPFAVAALVAAAGTAFAQPPTQPPEGAPVSPADAFIQQLDTDGDGKVSRAEALAPQTERFKEVDTDGDGFITAEEASVSFNAQVPAEMLEAMKERGMPDPGETFISNLDTDGDGKVSPSEFEQPTIDAFTRMDADGDGYATREEAEAYFTVMQQQMEEQMRRMQEQMQQQAPDAAPAQ